MQGLEDEVSYVSDCLTQMRQPHTSTSPIWHENLTKVPFLPGNTVLLNYSFMLLDSRMALKDQFCPEGLGVHYLHSAGTCMLQDTYFLADT